MLTIGQAIGTCLCALLAVLVARAIIIQPPKLPIPAGDACEVERLLRSKDRYAERLGAALRCKTVSYNVEPGSPDPTDYAELTKLHELLLTAFPLVHKHLTREVVAGHSLLYEWRGSEHATTRPYGVYAHLDVVPVPADDVPHWRQDPWAGLVKDGEIWGRGAIDDKQAVLGQLEAIEDLLASGFTPTRTVYVIFGHDEEVGGPKGAKAVSALLARRGVVLEFLLDEGLFVIDGVVPGHKRPVAMVCVAEKGYVNLRLSVECEPGHAARPPKHGSISILSAALARLADDPFPTHMSHCARPMFESLAGGFSWPMQLVMSNLWLFSPLLKRILGAKPTTSTLVRTTTALTVFKSGEKFNVLPREAYAIVNHRIHPADSVASVVARDIEVINDKRVKVEVLPDGMVEPSAVSSVSHMAYQTIAECVAEVFPHAAIAPGLFVAASDSKHFWSVADQIYRFNPIELSNEQTAMFHGDNERIGVDAHAKSIAWFRALHVRQNARPCSRV
jgi:carboxypeptidase PM20D1